MHAGNSLLTCIVAGAGSALGSISGAGADRCAEQGGLEALLGHSAALLQAALHFHEGTPSSCSTHTAAAHLPNLSISMTCAAA
jgi:hypothetical protein